MSSIDISESIACGPGTGQPAWDIPLGVLDPARYVPQKIFPRGAGTARQVWTWCPCDCEETGEGCSGIEYPQPTSSECPNLGDCPADIDGHWLSRGGDEDYGLGPPPVAGQYFGETVFVGNCCLESTSLSSLSPVDVEISLFSENSCSPYPPIYTILLQDLMPINWYNRTHPYGAGDLDMGEGNYNPEQTSAMCDVGTVCGMWIWCPCEESMSPCETVYPVTESCPYPGGAEGSGLTGPGEWLPFGGDAEGGAPCIVGDYYGQVVFKCECENCSSSSCICALQSTGSSGLSDPSILGDYSFEGIYNGKSYYRNCNTRSWTLHWAIDRWYISDEFSVWNGWQLVAADPDGTYTGFGSESGTVTLGWC
jgi:hypothetical protein